MTAITMTLPLARPSPLHMPRRDVVADPGDDVLLQMIIVTEDDPEAAAVSLEAPGTALQMLLWSAPQSRDYGPPILFAWNTLHTISAAITDAVAGRASLTVPRDLASRWPDRRLGFTLRLDLAGVSRTTLCWGALNLPRVCG